MYFLVDHFTVNHSVKFVHHHQVLNPADPNLPPIHLRVTTKHIERQWKEFKKYCKTNYYPLVEADDDGFEFDFSLINGYNNNELSILNSFVFHT